MSDLLSIERGAVVAPAGCGKTHLVATAFAGLDRSRPVLVLTHTNAGVAAMRGRLRGEGASPDAYRLGTLDGWAMHLVRTFPARSGVDPAALEVRDPGRDYRAIRDAAVALIGSGDIRGVLRASYSHVIVDEYQDCSVRQHAMIAAMSDVLPTVVLGDPMQAIFNFGDDPNADWDTQVLSVFPVVLELDTPWRWINSGATELGDWLLNARVSLASGRGVDLRGAPPAATWIQLDGTNDDALRSAAARTRPPGGVGQVLIIGDRFSPSSQQAVAKRTPGAATVESVELADLVKFAAEFEPTGPDSLDTLLRFASRGMTGVPITTYEARLSSLRAGRARKPASQFEQAALAYQDTPSPTAAEHVLSALARSPAARVYRPTLVKAAVKTLQLSIGKSASVERVKVAQRVRDGFRFSGRPLPLRGVGSTLLLKGLEAVVAVVLDAGGLDSKNLYVAMTRGSRALTVCSRSPVIGAGV